MGFSHLKNTTGAVPDLITAVFIFTMWPISQRVSSTEAATLLVCTAVCSLALSSHSAVLSSLCDATYHNAKVYLCSNLGL